MKNISIVAPASWIKDEYLFSAVNFLKSNGFKLKYAEQVRQTQNSYTAGSDADRINSLHEAFQNPETDIILCAKGGYGTSRIIDKLDVNILNNPHKIFLGYSDISLLNFFLIKYAPLTKVYFCPNLIDIAYLNCNPQENTLKYLINFLHRLPDQATLNQLLSQTKILKHGRAHTQIIGGTLTIMMNCLGTPFELDTNNKILFIEDKKEYAFKVERMLYHLKHAHKLDNIKGLIIGKFFETPEYHIPFGKDMETMFLDFFKDYDIPILYNFPLGHCDNKIPIPLNRTILLDTQKPNFGLRSTDLL